MMYDEIIKLDLDEFKDPQGFIVFPDGRAVEAKAGHSMAFLETAKKDYKELYLKVPEHLRALDSPVVLPASWLKKQDVLTVYTNNGKMYLYSDKDLTEAQEYTVKRLKEKFEFL